MKRAVVIVAGGSGSRMGAKVPKQFLLLAGRPILMTTIDRFHSFDHTMQIIVVLPESQIDYWQGLCVDYQFVINHKIIKGGNSRFQSVANGLAAISDDVQLVAVHDGVRPLVNQNTIYQCFMSAAADGAAIPVVPAVESVRWVEDGASKALNRANIRLVQTPQVFRREVIIASYMQPYVDSFTDDASVAEAAGYAITLVEGNRENIKITTPDDLIFAEALMARES